MIFRHATDMNFLARSRNLKIRWPRRSALLETKPYEEPEPAKAPSVPTPEVVTTVFTPSIPRMKGDIVGYSAESDDNEIDTAMKMMMQAMMRKRRIPKLNSYFQP